MSRRTKTILASKALSGTGWTTILERDLDGDYDKMVITIMATTTALTDFRFRLRTSKNGTLVPKYSGTDWVAANGVIRADEWSGKDDAGGGKSVNTLGATESVLLELNVTGYAGFDIAAKDGVGTATVSVDGVAVEV